MSLGGIARVVIVGEIGKFGTEVRYSQNGTPIASFMLAVTELGQDGKTYTTLIPAEVIGKKAEACSELEAGTPVAFEGRLKTRKKDEAWQLYVQGFELSVLTLPAAVSAT